jgi:hypothetical protein
MANPWDIPYQKKFKWGDASEELIYQAVGRALSKWEGLEAEVTSLFGVITTGTDQWDYVPAVRAFGSVNSPVARAEMLSHAAEAFFDHFENFGLYDEAQPHRDELKELLVSYKGWSARRNDLAHGCVTTNYLPDMFKDDQPVTATYLLFPSHTSSKKWPLRWEPTYKYRASEIERFATEFESLHQRFSSYSDNLDRWRKDMLSRLSG